MASTNEISMFSSSGNVVVLSQGCAIGWISPALPILLSEDSPLASGPLTKTEAGWIGSVIPCGALFGCMLFGILANYIGSKNSLTLTVFPLIVST